MPRFPAPLMALSEAPVHKLTICNLPEDLLAHVLRFTTASLRRDGHPGRPASVRHLRYAAISPAFRRAFLRHLQAIFFDHPASRRLALLNWGPLRSCIALRKIAVSRTSKLRDEDLTSLFSFLSFRGIFIRDFELTLGEHVTAVTLVALAEHFGKYLIRLRVALEANPAVRSHRDGQTHQAVAAQGAHFNGGQAPIPVEEPLLPNEGHGNENGQGPVEAQLGEEIPANELPFEAPADPFPGTPGEGDPDQNGNALLPVLHMMNNGGFAGQNHGWNFANNLIDAQLIAASQNLPAHHQYIGNRPSQPISRNDNVNDRSISVEAGDNVPIYTASSNAENDAVEIFAKNLGTHPAFARDLTELIGDSTGRFLDPAPHLNETIVSNQVLQKVITAMPNLIDFALIRTKHVTDEGIRALVKCSDLQKLQLCHLPKVTDSGLVDVLKHLSNVLNLSLSRMDGVGNGTINALVRGPSSSKFQSLKLVMIEKIKDPCIKFLVNGCEMLKNVSIMFCSSVSDTAASHLSCARNIESATFHPHPISPLSSRAVVHLSCAAVSMRALTLGSCKGVGLDAIVALANLPQLRKLHMGGLRSLSMGAMRALGAFPRLEDLLLEGQMYLTDLGVKMLCGQRGHRFIHLVLADDTKSLTDDALDCIMTWCTSLRTLEVAGNFKPGVLDRLHDAIPHADIKVVAAAVNVGGFLEGDRCVWD